MWKGTAADHAKAQWFTELWQDAIKDWVAEFNQAFAEVAEVFERLRARMDDDSRFGECESLVEGVIGTPRFRS